MTRTISKSFLDHHHSFAVMKVYILASCIAVLILEGTEALTDLDSGTLNNNNHVNEQMHFTSNNTSEEFPEKEGSSTTTASLETTISSSPSPTLTLTNSQRLQHLINHLQGSPLIEGQNDVPDAIDSSLPSSSPDTNVTKSSSGLIIPLPASATFTARQLLKPSKTIPPILPIVSPPSLSRDRFFTSTECEGESIIHDRRGTIHSPSYPFSVNPAGQQLHHPDNTHGGSNSSVKEWKNCSWIILGSRKDDVITVSFDDVDFGQDADCVMKRIVNQTSSTTTSSSLSSSLSSSFSPSDPVENCCRSWISIREEGHGYATTPSPPSSTESSDAVSASSLKDHLTNPIPSSLTTTFSCGRSSESELFLKPFTSKSNRIRIEFVINMKLPSEENLSVKKKNVVNRGFHLSYYVSRESSSSCKPNEFHCGSSTSANSNIGVGSNRHTKKKGKCIPDSWRCNRKSECPDSSDELDCDDVCSGPTEVKCNAGLASPGFVPSFGSSLGSLATIPSSISLLPGCYSFATERCDGKWDCMNGADERGCGGCPANMFICYQSKTCYSESKRCDGVTDCPDFSDEINCGFCGGNKTLCDPKGSLTTCYDPFTERCNRQIDCPNGVDEKGCMRGCETKIACSSGTGCYDLEERCNGIPDCNDYSDEKNCSIENCRLEKGSFLCANRRCVRSTWVCDRSNDCGDASDEINCLKNSVITAAIMGSLVCGLLLVIAISCTCKLIALRQMEVVSRGADYSYSGDRSSSSSSRHHLHLRRGNQFPSHHHVHSGHNNSDGCSSQHLVPPSVSYEQVSASDQHPLFRLEGSDAAYFYREPPPSYSVAMGVPEIVTAGTSLLPPDQCPYDPRDRVRRSRRSRRHRRRPPSPPTLHPNITGGPVASNRPVSRDGTCASSMRPTLPSTSLPTSSSGSNNNHLRVSSSAAEADDEDASSTGTRNDSRLEVSDGVQVIKDTSDHLQNQSEEGIKVETDGNTEDNSEDADVSENKDDEQDGSTNALVPLVSQGCSSFSSRIHRGHHPQSLNVSNDSDRKMLSPASRDSVVSIELDSMSIPSPSCTQTDCDEEPLLS